MNRGAEVKREPDTPAELESQFILRLPAEPAKIVREAIRSGAVHLRDRLSIRLEDDMRYGEVRVDHCLLHAKVGFVLFLVYFVDRASKLETLCEVLFLLYLISGVTLSSWVVDLPTVIESLKTIDNKSFYKTADLCQILICKEEDDQTTTDEESPSKTKKKDPNKVDKKFLWPHGITPPLKNVRRRRFRKTLKKKYVEAPEIEKEVKRLLRVDNDAVNVKWEVICEDEERKSGFVKAEYEGDTGEGDPGPSGDLSLETSNPHSVDVVEREIFGGTVSDSDEEEEETNINVIELEEETSRPSAEDSRLSDSTSLQGTTSERQHLVTEFSKEMFNPRTSYADRSKSGSSLLESVKEEPEYRDIPSEFQPVGKAEMSFDFDLLKTELNSEEDNYAAGSEMSRETIRARLEILEKELTDLRNRRQQQELEIANIENQALRQRFQDILDNLLTEMLEKEQEYQELTALM